MGLPSETSPFPFSEGRAIVSENIAGHVTRRRAAILFAGYPLSRPNDNADGFSRLSRLRTETIEPQILAFSGHLLRWTGDGVFVEFESVIEAVGFAVGLQDILEQMNQTSADEQRIAIRIGINFDDVIVEEGEIFGDGVNIAARVQALAKPGSVLSEAVHDQVTGKVDFEFEGLGPQELKNIVRPIRVYRMAGEIAELSETLLANDARLAAPLPSFDDRRHGGVAVRQL